MSFPDAVLRKKSAIRHTIAALTNPGSQTEKGGTVSFWRDALSGVIFCQGRVR